MPFLKKHWPLLLILTVAFLVRLLAVLQYGDFWGDEMFSFVYSQKPWLLSLTKFWIWETNPPLHLLLLKLWWYVFPATEWYARLPSLLFGVASVYAIYALGKKMFNQRTGIVAALLLALSPYNIFLSATTRVYALLLLLTILSLNYFYTIFFLEQKTRWQQIIFSVIALLLLYAHLTGLVVLALEILLVWIMRRKKIKSLFKLFLWPFLLWLPWAIPAAFSKITTPHFGQAWFFTIEQTPASLLNAFRPLFTGLGAAYWALLIIFIFFATTIWTMYQQRKNDRPNEAFIVLLIFSLLPLVAALFLGLWNIKFIVFTLPTVQLLVAYFLTTYLARWPTLIGIFCLLLVLPGLVELTFLLPLEKWSTLNKYISTNINPAKNQLLIYSNFTDEQRLNRYFNFSIPALPYYALTEKENWDKTIITQNYLRIIHPLSELQNWYQAENLKNYNDIFVLEVNTIGEINLSKLLEQNGWHLLASPFKPHLLGDYILLHYGR